MTKTPGGVYTAAQVEREQRIRELQAQWHEAKAKWEAVGRRPGPEMVAWLRVDATLCSTIWQGVQEDIAEDRKRHPKARRNAPVGESSGGGRALP